MFLIAAVGWRFQIGVFNCHSGLVFSNWGFKLQLWLGVFKKWCFKLQLWLDVFRLVFKIAIVAWCFFESGVLNCHHGFVFLNWCWKLPLWLGV